MEHPSTSDLEAGLEHVRHSPADVGRIELVVRRPAENEREVLAEGRLDIEQGLVGDTWLLRPSSRSAGGGPHPDMQLNAMNARMVDLDLSEENLPAGTRLTVGTAVTEVTHTPHRGGDRFAAWFGLDVLRFVNSPVGQKLRLRGLNARVVTSGVVHPGDIVRKEAP
jgi:hypothetical protein